MIRSIAVALALVMIGDAMAAGLDAPVPGASIGLLLLVAYFVARGELDAGSARLFDFAAPHFPLFFVPAAVGVVACADVLTHAWIYITAAIVIGTSATIIATGMIAQALLGRTASRRAVKRTFNRGTTA